MERSKYIIILISFFFFTNTLVYAGNRAVIYDAYISNNMNKWKNVIDLMEKQSDKSDNFLLELINYQYGYIAWCLGNNTKAEAAEYLKIAEKNLMYLENKSYKLSYINAYKSAFYGFKIGINNFQAPFIGPKSIKSAETAVELDVQNPFGYIQYGNIMNFMPKMFGGSVTKAIDYYLIAIRIMETPFLYNNKKDWNYLNLLALTGKAYQDIEDYEKAKYFYEKTLGIEADFLWVKNNLYPNLIKITKK